MLNNCLDAMRWMVDQCLKVIGHQICFYNSKVEYRTDNSETMDRYHLEAPSFRDITFISANMNLMVVWCVGSKPDMSNLNKSLQGKQWMKMEGGMGSNPITFTLKYYRKYSSKGESLGFRQTAVRFRNFPQYCRIGQW